MQIHRAGRLSRRDSHRTRVPGPAQPPSPPAPRPPSQLRCDRARPTASRCRSPYLQPGSGSWPVDGLTDLGAPESDEVLARDRFLENDREQIEGADPEHQELAAFVTAWAAQHGDKPVTAGELADMVGLHGLLGTGRDLE